MEFQVWSVYLLYTGLMVHTTLNLVSSKEHALNILYDTIVLESFISFYIIYKYVMDI